MKVFYIYLTDYPTEHIKAICKNVSDARKQAKQYIKAWNLDADILKIDYVEEFKN